MDQLDAGARSGPPRPAPGAPTVEILIAAVAPGLPTLRRRAFHGAVLLTVGVVAPLAWLGAAVLRHNRWVELGLDADFLDQLIVAIVVAVIARLAGVGEVVASGAHQPGHRVRSWVAVAALLGVTVPSAIAVAAVADSRDDLNRAFASNERGPIFDAAALPTVSAPPVVPTVPLQPPPSNAPPAPTERDEHGRYRPAPVDPFAGRPDSGVDPRLLADVSTILLLGGDAGPGRSGLRTDSMILVSIHRPSGRAALISFPRNAERILFPPGTYLADRFPNGFDEIANAVYPLVSHRPEWRANYEVPGLRPGAVAISHAIGYSLDVTIDDYVLIDMQGFLEVIDALGGVTIDVPKAVPAPGNPPGAKHEVPEIIAAGVQHMDGTLALSYVRSRKADSDYSRMRRQRQLLGALASQLSLTDAVSNYARITSALGSSLHTSLTADEFADLLALLGGETAIVESVGLAPPLIDPVRPDYDAMAKIVGRVRLALVVGEPSGY